MNEPMHTTTINNATCDTGHLHICSLTHSEHRHPQDYEIKHNLKLVKSIEYLYICDEINSNILTIQKLIAKHNRRSKFVNCLKKK